MQYTVLLLAFLACGVVCETQFCEYTPADFEAPGFNFYYDESCGEKGPCGCSDIKRDEAGLKIVGVDFECCEDECCGGDCCEEECCDGDCCETFLCFAFYFFVPDFVIDNYKFYDTLLTVDEEEEGEGSEDYTLATENAEYWDEYYYLWYAERPARTITYHLTESVGELGCFRFQNDIEYRWIIEVEVGHVINLSIQMDFDDIYATLVLVDGENLTLDHVPSENERAGDFPAYEVYGNFQDRTIDRTSSTNLYTVIFRVAQQPEDIIIPCEGRGCECFGLECEEVCLDCGVEEVRKVVFEGTPIDRYRYPCVDEEGGCPGFNIFYSATPVCDAVTVCIDDDGTSQLECGVGCDGQTTCGTCSEDRECISGHCSLLPCESCESTDQDCIDAFTACNAARIAEEVSTD